MKTCSRCCPSFPVRILIMLPILADVNPMLRECTVVQPRQNLLMWRVEWSLTLQFEDNRSLSLTLQFETIIPVSCPATKNKKHNHMSTQIVRGSHDATSAAICCNEVAFMMYSKTPEPITVTSNCVNRSLLLDVPNTIDLGEP